MPAEVKNQLASAVEQLLAGNVPPGRRYEKLEGYDDVYSIRLNDKYRFVFKVYEDGGAIPIAVGPHDEAYAAIPRALKAVPRDTNHKSDELPTGADQPGTYRPA